MDDDISDEKQFLKLPSDDESDSDKEETVIDKTAELLLQVNIIALIMVSLVQNELIKFKCKAKYGITSGSVLLIIRSYCIVDTV